MLKGNSASSTESKLQDKYFTFEEYKNIIAAEQTDKDGNIIYLYATDKVAQYSYIEAATARGYDVLLMDGQLDAPYIGMLEQKLEKSRFVRVDSDILDNLIRKENAKEVKLTAQEREAMTTVFKSQIPAIDKCDFMIMFEAMGENAAPVMITQSEYMRRMKDMAAIQPGMSFYGELPDSFNLIVNTDHALSKRVMAETDAACQERIAPLASQLNEVNAEIARLNDARKDKKDDEIPVADKEALRNAENTAADLRKQQDAVYSEFAKGNDLVKQLIDLALLSNNMLRGEELSKFVKRSFGML